VKLVAAPTLDAEPLGRVLTGAEYDALPENPLRELVDGVIRIMATPTAWHQYVVRELGHRLDLLAKPNLRVVGPIELRLADHLRRNPDLAVVHASAYDRRKNRFLPAEVDVAIEVVSPGSETDDRREKPSEYAEAQIPFYWRVELESELAIHVYQLHLYGHAYSPVAVFKSGQTVDVPGLEWARVDVTGLED
jgi:Uma2 family endonuclease